MNRGYIKFWRKAQDSSSWNRGLMYQGLIINFLSRAAWKKGGYQGRDILPGQFGAVLRQLADSLDVPKTTFNRMLSHLEKDGFLTVENVGNRFSIITITNWHNYQESSKDEWDARGTPAVRQRDARGTPSYNEEEERNKKEEIYNNPLGEEHTFARAHEAEGSVYFASPAFVPDPPADPSPQQPQQPAQTPRKASRDFLDDPPGLEFQELRHYYDQHGRQEAPLAGFLEYKQLRAAKHAWPGQDAIYHALERHERLDPGWRSYAPGLAKFLRERWWQMEPKARASPAGAQLAPTTFAQQQALERQSLASFGLAANQELQNGLKTSNSSKNSRFGNDLPSQHEPGRVPGPLPGVPREFAGHD